MAPQHARGRVLLHSRAPSPPLATHTLRRAPLNSRHFHLAPSQTQLLRHRTRLRLRLRRLYTSSSMAADDDDSRAGSTSPSQHVHEALLAAHHGRSVVFMTGYPGFLASALAERLLCNDPALQLHCLVQRAFVTTAQVGFTWTRMRRGWRVRSKLPERTRLATSLYPSHAQCEQRLTHALAAPLYNPFFFSGTRGAAAGGGRSPRHAARGRHHPGRRPRHGR